MNNALLTEAVYRGATESLQILLQHGCDPWGVYIAMPNNMSELKLPLLYFAIAHKLFDIAWILMGHFANTSLWQSKKQVSRTGSKKYCEIMPYSPYQPYMVSQFNHSKFVPSVFLERDPNKVKKTKFVNIFFVYDPCPSLLTLSIIQMPELAISLYESGIDLISQKDTEWSKPLWLRSMIPSEVESALNSSACDLELARSMGNVELSETFRLMLCNPRSLFLMCRILVRNLLGRNIVKKLQKLNVPLKLFRVNRTDLE